MLCTAVRTPIGAFGGALKDTAATKLGAAVMRAVIERSGLAPAEIDSVVMGHVVQAGARMNPARQAAIGGGLPVKVPEGFRETGSPPTDGRIRQALLANAGGRPCQPAR